MSITISNGNPFFLFRSDLSELTESASTSSPTVDKVDRRAVVFFGSLAKDGKDPVAIMTPFDRAVMEIWS